MKINFKIIAITLVVMITFSCSGEKTTHNDKYELKTGHVWVDFDVYKKAELTPAPMKIRFIDLYFDKGNRIEVKQYSKGRKYKYGLIKGEKYIETNNLKDSLDFTRAKNLADKKLGVNFGEFKEDSLQLIKPMNDTILGSDQFKRYSVRKKKKNKKGEIYSVYYVKQTDTILPITMGKTFDSIGNGILTRIDRYDIEKDMFITSKLKYNDTIPEGVYKKLKTM